MRIVSLILSFTLRDLKERYVATGLGQFWYILSPVVTIAIYTIIFSEFMQMKLDIVDSSYSYSIYLISGLLAWNSFSTIIQRLNSSLLDRANFIKKIDVPAYVYMLSIAVTESIILFISYILALIFLLIISYPITTAFLYLLPLLVLQSIFALSIGSIFALFTPFFRDLKEALPIITQLWFWMTPIIYLSQMIESKFPALLIYNPIYYYIRLYQNIFIYAKSPSLSELVIVIMLSFIPLLLAAYLYKKMIPTIKDII